MARKNGKTSMAAGGAISHILQDKEIGAQIYIVATKEEQARIGFEDMQKFIQSTPEISPLFQHLRPSTTYKMSVIKPLGSNSKAQDGFDPSWGIVDEYHAHKTDGMLNILESGMGARTEPMLNIITTAGFNQQAPCYRLRKNCIDVLEGRQQDDTLFSLIYALDEEDDWKDSEVWGKANPNLGVSVKSEFIKNRINQAINEGGTKEVDVKTKNLNIWTDAAETWIGQEIMNRNIKLNTKNLEGQRCYAGLDLAKGVDINALVLYFPDTGDVLPFFWIPENKLKNNRDGVDYTNWRDKGMIFTTPGDIVDQEAISIFIMECTEKYDVRGLAYDRYIAFNGLVQSLIQEGFTEMSPFGQGFVSMSEPAKELEKLLTEGVLKINNDVMKWMFGNVVLSFDAAGNIKPDKKKSEKKIDGPVALVMALGEFMTQEANVSGSIYDTDIDIKNLVI
jgi:phage terminase large subunit-like protein